MSLSEQDFYGEFVPFEESSPTSAGLASRLLKALPLPRAQRQAGDDNIRESLYLLEGYADKVPDQEMENFRLAYAEAMKLRRNAYHGGVLDKTFSSRGYHKTSKKVIHLATYMVENARMEELRKLLEASISRHANSGAQDHGDGSAPEEVGLQASKDANLGTPISSSGERAPMSMVSHCSVVCSIVGFEIPIRVTVVKSDFVSLIVRTPSGAGIALHSESDSSGEA